mgnify:CR=1 FL=1
MDKNELVTLLKKELLKQNPLVVYTAKYLDELQLLGYPEEYDGWLQCLIEGCLKEESAEIIADQALDFLKSDMIEWDREP